MGLIHRIRTIFAVSLMLVPMVLLPVSANASTGFQPGRIIDDNIFFNGSGMSASSIQGFLNSKVPNCDTNGLKPYAGTTRAAYSAANGNNPPFTCLKDYRQNTPNKPAENGLCNDYRGGDKSVAEMIQDIGAACGVNQKVLLVLLEKEQSLITDDWPWKKQYDAATGFGCPDTSVCDPEYGSFFNQIYYAARQFKRYARDASLFNYKVGLNNYIQYNPNASCGGTNIFIQNQATAGLYNYTPYQPNQAALNNLLGTGDSCSAYGNRNFWRLFNDWFGPTTSDSDANSLSFVRLNHSSGNVENISLPSIGSYRYISRNVITPYPAVSSDGSVVPIYKPGGDLSFIRLNHSSGNVEVVTYTAASGFTQLSSILLTAYPSVSPDGSVIPMYRSNGDLSFIRLNHPSGNVEVVTYTAASSYKQLKDIRLSSYPAVPIDRAVVPLFWLNDDLAFVRLNHSSGNVELVSYSDSSQYKRIVFYGKLPYPSVPSDRAVVPLFSPSGNLSFIRLNHTSGNVEVVTYTASSAYKQLSSIQITTYPSVIPDGAVVPLYSR